MLGAAKVVGLMNMTVLGVRVAGGLPGDALADLEAAVSERPPVSLAFANAHVLKLAARDGEYRSQLDRFDFVLNDGVGVSMAARMQGRRFPANLNGSDFTPKLLRRCAENGWRVYLLGGLPGVAEEAGAKLKREIPALQVAGTRHGYFEPEDEAAVAATVRASGAQVVLVGLGNPDQEAWLDRNLAGTGARLGVGVGAFLDFAAGRVRRAPAWVNSAGLEWVYRLLREPGRLWRRYLLGNPEFLARVAWERMFSRGARRTGHAAAGRSSGG
jgi:exopolysaccharide biosynthesis WecB/TagA/CpsF family protein